MTNQAVTGSRLTGYIVSVMRSPVIERLMDRSWIETQQKSVWLVSRFTSESLNLIYYVNRFLLFNDFVIRWSQSSGILYENSQVKSDTYNRCLTLPVNFHILFIHIYHL